MKTYVGKRTTTNNMCRKGLHELTDDNIHVFKRTNGSSYRTCLICFRLKTRTDHLQRYYNLTLEEYDVILETQNYKCAICFTDDPDSSGYKKYFCIDHDHNCCPDSARSCGKCIRGLLCWSCNRRLESLDNWTTDELESALSYRKIREVSI